MDDKVLDPESTVMAIFPSPMMYAGPTEVRLVFFSKLLMYVRIQQQFYAANVGSVYSVYP